MRGMDRSYTCPRGGLPQPARRLGSVPWVRDLIELVGAADEAALLRAVDGLCSTRSWDRLVDLARLCREAVEMGRQLWAVAMHIDYRLALEAPASYAGAVLRPGAGRFTLGPLTEVAAGRHAFADLAPHISDIGSAAAVAQERVLRGEDLRGRTGPVPAELPLRLAVFEPDYALPTYRDREARFPAPATPSPPSDALTVLDPAPLQPDDPAAGPSTTTASTSPPESAVQASTVLRRAATAGSSGCSGAGSRTVSASDGGDGVAGAGKRASRSR